jgi:hypothetical protein
MTKIIGFGYLKFGNWNLLGDWDLEIGISTLCALRYAALDE